MTSIWSIVGRLVWKLAPGYDARMDEREIVVVTPNSEVGWVDFVPVFTALGVIIAACIALYGVYLAQKKQGQQAEKDRQNALTLAKEERDAQEERAQREWYREKQFDALTALLAQITRTHSLIVDRKPVVEELRTFELLAQQVSALTQPDDSFGNDLVHCTKDVYAQFNRHDNNGIIRELNTTRTIVLVLIRGLRGEQPTHQWSQTYRSDPSIEVKEEAQGQ